MPTFQAPVIRPGRDTRAEAWRAESLDGLWEYWREDEDGTPWSVRYRPTGQQRVSAFPSLPEAQRATATWLPDQLRAEALRLVLDTTLDDLGRMQAQRSLGVWLRAAIADGGDAEQAAVCRCGGLLVDVNFRGGLLRVHIDACDRCWPAGTTRPLPADGCTHQFCPARSRYPHALKPTALH